MLDLSHLCKYNKVATILAAIQSPYEYLAHNWYGADDCRLYTSKTKPIVTVSKSGCKTDVFNIDGHIFGYAGVLTWFAGDRLNTPTTNDSMLFFAKNEFTNAMNDKISAAINKAAYNI